MSVLVTTTDGYHVFTSGGEHVVALGGHHMRGLTAGPAGTWIAIVDRREVWQHDAAGEWHPLASADVNLACLVTAGDVVYAGSADARVLRLDGGDLVPLPGFDRAPGRDEWHGVGSATHVRSLTATAEDGAILANVHVGGILRTTDGGESWKPTIAVDDDAHEVRAHPSDPDVVAAAAAVGLFVSSDAGESWQLIDTLLTDNSTYSRAVAFFGDDVLCSVSDGPFTTRGAIYRLAAGARVPERVRDGLPEWLDGNVDTHCLAVSSKGAALADERGHVWISTVGIRDWNRVAALEHVTAVAIA